MAGIKQTDKMSISEKIDIYQDEILIRNYRNLEKFTLGGMLITGFISLVAIVFFGKVLFTAEYCICFIHFLLWYFITKYILKDRIQFTLLVFYIVLVPIFIIGILMGTFLDPNDHAITIMILLCTLFMFITDKPRHIIAYILTVSLCFITCSYLSKPSDFFVGDLANLIIYLSIGLSVNMLTLYERVSSAENYVLVKQRTQLEFYSRMSHDMRTPMNGIIGIAALSEDEYDVNTLRENLRKIRGSGEYLLELINDTLDYQKIETGRMTLDCTPVKTQELIDHIFGMVQTIAEQKGVSIQLREKHADLDGRIHIDAMRVKQIFINLISNAIKFTPYGGKVDVCIECTGRYGSIAHDIITVTDTGVGMSEEFIKNGLFNPFSQEYSEMTTTNTGSGLGLSIVKHLIEMMNGTIEVESKLGVGTKFVVHLDFEHLPKAEVGEQPEQHFEDKEILQGKHILLAEDHVLNAEIAQKLLKRKGVFVDWAKDGRECLELFLQSKENYYDIILMDIRMPQMDGLEATRQIRALDRTDAGTVSIIAMSANAYAEDVQKSLEAGMNGHLAKPVDPPVLYETLEKELFQKLS